jgi:acetyl esterase
MVTAGNDPLREQDLDYLAKLAAAGVKVTLYDYQSMVHGFFTLPGYFPQGSTAIDALAKHIREL